MVTAEEIGRFEVFATLATADRERLCRVAADISLGAQEFAVHEGDEPGLLGLLEGHIEVVKLVDGVERVIGERRPGDLIGEISITLGTPHPAGFRAIEASRVFRIEPHDYHAAAAVAPEVGKHIGRLVSNRLSGPRGQDSERRDFLRRRVTGMRECAGVSLEPSHAALSPGPAFGNVAPSRVRSQCALRPGGGSDG
jgi:thioredoxin reductase (NADPH)